MEQLHFNERASSEISNWTNITLLALTIVESRVLQRTSNKAGVNLPCGKGKNNLRLDECLAVF